MAFWSFRLNQDGVIDSYVLTFLPPEEWRTKAIPDKNVIVFFRSISKTKRIGTGLGKFYVADCDAEFVVTRAPFPSAFFRD